MRKIWLYGEKFTYFWSWATLIWRKLIYWLANLRRRLLHARLPNYVILTLDGGLEERNPLQPWWYDYLPGRKAPFSLEALQRILRQIAGDPEIDGVVFLCKAPILSLAQAQSLAALCARFRHWDAEWNGATQSAPKEIIFHIEQFSRPLYVAACAADKILVPPLTTWEMTGLRSEPTFFKHSLARIGVAFDVVRVAPWKNAMDRFTHDELSDEARRQTEWLLESWFEQMVRAIVSGRKLSQERVRWLIDQAPWEALAAFEHGLIDGVLYEDELPAFLGSAGKAAVLKPYAQIRSLLLHRLHRRSDRAIGVISLQGSIMPGVSQNFPLPLPVFGEHTAGSATVQQMVRAARKDESLAAVILHIDSPGGSASASDLMWRDLLLLGQEKPLIIYMGDVAASGGYYVAAPGAKIVAQAATLTGSIGVFIAKGVTSELYAKIDARRQVIQRGENAGLYSELSLWSPNERAKVQANLDTIYREFKERVAEGRKLPYETLDEICGGRVWTGEQAQAHGLVDALGDFTVAVELARQAAHLPADQDVPLVVIQPAKRFLPAEPVSKSLQRLGEVLLLGKVEKLTLGQHVWLWADGLPSVKE